MRGSVRKRGAGWEWRARTPDGRDVSRGGFRLQGDAEEALAKALVAMFDGRYVEPDRLTVEGFLVNVWLPAIKATVEPTTYAGYKVHVDRHLVPHLGAFRLQKITEAHLIAMYGELAKSGNQRGRLVDENGKPREPIGLSSTSIRRIHATLHHALSDAVEWRYLSRNVAAGKRAKPPKARRVPEMKVWTASELQTFLGHVRNERLHPLWRFVAMTGVRRGEALGLRWCDVDLGESKVSIVRARTTQGVSTPKTTRGRRLLELDPQTVAVLKQWRKDQLEERMKWAEHWTDTGLVFTREDGKGYHPDGITGAFARLQTKYNDQELAKAKEARRQPALLPVIRLHDLRHTHATLLLASGEHPKVVSERLGHATPAFTLTVYAHVLPGLQKAAIGRLASLVDG